MCSDQPRLSLDNQVRVALTSPQSILVNFFESQHCDAFVFTYDPNRHLKYISSSLGSLVGVSDTELQELSFHELLTDHPWNQVIRDENEFLLNPGECHHALCELGLHGSRTLVALRRQIVIEDRQIVGILGVGWRLEDSQIMGPETMVSYALGISESTLMERWKKLTPAEIQVIEAVSIGQLNKTIAKNLTLSVRTVEARRSRVMRKLGIASVPELVRFHLLVKHTLENKSRGS